MKKRNFFKFFLVVIPRFFASFFDRKIDEMSDIFDSKKEDNFIGYEKPYSEHFIAQTEKSPEIIS